MSHIFHRRLDFAIHGALDRLRVASTCDSSSVYCRSETCVAGARSPSSVFRDLLRRFFWVRGSGNSVVEGVAIELVSGGILRFPTRIVRSVGRRECDGLVVVAERSWEMENGAAQNGSAGSAAPLSAMAQEMIAVDLSSPPHSPPPQPPTTPFVQR